MSQKTYPLALEKPNSETNSDSAEDSVDKELYKYSRQLIINEVTKVGNFLFSFLFQIITKINNKQTSDHPPGRRRRQSTDLFSSDEEEEQEEYLETTTNLFGRRSRHRGNDWGRGRLFARENIIDAIKSWSARQLSPEKKHYYYHQNRELFCGNGNLIMARLKDLSITKIALFSRIILLGIEIFANIALDDGRHHNDGFRFVHPEMENTKAWDMMVNSTLGGFSNWDGQYFLHIAINGYTSENMLAFFPLLPTMISYISKFVYLFVGLHISYTSLVLLIAWSLNTLLFIRTANLLYDFVSVVGVVVDPTPVIIMFCFNPASIFFSSVYTESLFMYLTLKVLLSLYNEKPYEALVFAALGTLCRSNGILNFGFVAAYFLQISWLKYWRNKQNQFGYLFTRAAICVAFLTPFIMFQGYAITKFCTENENSAPYCRYETLPYSYIQKKYWDVGPFKYFQLKQIPNFILAAPVLYLQFTKTWKKFTPLVAKLYAHPSSVNLFSLYTAAHGVFLAIFCFTFVHVQVSTRLILSAYPYLYLYIVESCGDEIVAFRQRTILWPIQVTCIQLWCLFYFIFGTIAFSLGYPWT